MTASLPQMGGFVTLWKHQLSAAAVLPLCLAAGLAGWAVAATRKRFRAPPAVRSSSSSTRQVATGGERSPAAKLRKLLADQKGESIIVMPCCYDGLTAKLVERAGFQLTFMTGFGVSAVHGFADCQLVSYQEMLESAFRICGSLASCARWGLNGISILVLAPLHPMQGKRCHMG